MIFSEQRHKNLNRKYYHGFNLHKTKKLSCNEFYLTTSFVYAAENAEADGYVVEYLLKKEINVFNALSKKDFELLRNRCEKTDRKFLNVLSRLKNDDWFRLFDYEVEKRQELLEIIEDLGFDGYFNFEIDNELERDYVERDTMISPSLIHSPAMAVFSKDCLIETQTFYGREDFIKNEDVQRARQTLIDYLAYRFLELYEKGKLTQRNVQKLYQNVCGIHFFTLQELYDVTKNWTFEELFKDKNKFIHEFSFLKEKTYTMIRPVTPTIKKRAIRIAERIFNESLDALYI